MRATKQASLQLGAAGETLVKEYLTRHGFTVIAQNMRIQGGEIDLIARNNDLVVCVEVKTRTNFETDMAELISPWQQQRIVRAAHHFLAKHQLDTVTCRFDVALVAMHPEPSLDYIPNAFEGD